MSGLTGVSAIAGGGRHSLALLSSGSVMAWGETKPASSATDQHRSGNLRAVCNALQHDTGGGGHARRGTRASRPARLQPGLWPSAAGGEQLAGSGALRESDDQKRGL